MNIKLITKVIESYNRTLDDTDKARLAFFKGLWEEMDRWSGGPVAAVKNYELPDKDTFFAQWHDDKPVFSYQPCPLETDRLVAIFNALRTYVVGSGLLAKDTNEALKNFDVEPLFTRELLEVAGSNPYQFIEAVHEKLDDGDAVVARMVLLLVMLSLRVEFEPVAQQLKKLFPRGDDCHHNPLHCPVCGSDPALAKIGGETSPTDGRGRSLYCQQCGCEWDFERIRCARCGTQNPVHLHLFNIEGDDGHRIATCDECGNYIRSIFLEESLMPFSFEVEEVVTARLDAVANDPRFQARKDADVNADTDTNANA